MAEEPRATSKASRLLQEDGPAASCASPETAKQLRQVFESKEKLVNIVQISLLDFKRQSPVKVKSCVEVLLRLLHSILENPAEDKFRKVKESSKVFSTNIAPFKAASDFLSTAGWRLKTIDFESHWICEAQPGTQEWRLLQEAESVLEDSLKFLEQKSEKHLQENATTNVKQAAEQLHYALENDRVWLLQKHLKEKATTKDKQAAERERVRNAIQDDKQTRKFHQETRVMPPASPPPSRDERMARKQNRLSPGMTTHQLNVRDAEGNRDEDLHDDLSDTQNDDD